MIAENLRWAGEKTTITKSLAICAETVSLPKFQRTNYWSVTSHFFLNSNLPSTTPPPQKKIAYFQLQKIQIHCHGNKHNKRRPMSKTWWKVNFIKKKYTYLYILLIKWCPSCTKLITTIIIDITSLRFRPDLVCNMKGLELALPKSFP